MADGKAFADPDVLRRLTSSVSSALDEAAAALTRMRTQNNGVPSSPNHPAEAGKISVQVGSQWSMTCQIFELTRIEFES